MRARIFILVASIAAVAYACGGADPVTIGSGDGGESGDDDSGAGRRDAGGGKDASIATRDSGSGDDGGLIIDSGTHDSGAHDAGHDGGTHPHNDGGIVPCGSVDDAGVTCNESNPTCCGIQYDQFTIVADDTFICSSSPTACADYDSGAANVAIACRDDSYCPGDQVCCGHLVTNGFSSAYEFVDCESDCPLVDDAGAATDYRRFCDPSGADECSATGETCGPSTLLPGFNVCQ